MKIAIIISGEYRTFSLCRKTMAFLDDLDNDVYVTTWNFSSLKSDYLNIDIQQEITEELIKSDLNRDIIAIDIEDFNKFKGTAPTMLLMINRWCRGIELVAQSGKEYDYIFLTRPDMFFHTGMIRKKLKDAAVNWSKDIFYCSSSKGINNDVNLNDFMFLGSPKVLNAIVTHDLLNDYRNDNNREHGTINWHDWWYKRVIKNFKINNIPPELDMVTLGRPVPNVVTFELAEMYHKMWFNFQIAQHVDEGGIDRASRNWSREVIHKALSDLETRVSL